MLIIFCESQKMVAITFSTDWTVFTFFGARLPGEVDCFECLLVSAVYQWSHVSSMVTKRCRNSCGLRLNLFKHCFEVVSRLPLLAGVSKRGTHGVDSFRITKISCSYLAHLQSAVCQYEIVDYCDVIIRGNRFWGTWAWLIKKQRETTLKFIKPFLAVAITGAERS